MSLRRIFTSLILFATLWASSTAFAPPCSSTNTKYAIQRLPLSKPSSHCMATQTISYHTQRRGQRLSATKSDEDIEKTVSSMKAKEIRQELESYGISTKSFFEKSQMVDALVKARKEGKTPVNSSADSGGDTAKTQSESKKKDDNSNNKEDRTERIKQEMEKCSKLKVGELKKELESTGDSTKSFFEKSEFVKAVAELRVDGPPKSSSGRSSGSRTSGRVEEEPRDSSYRDVTVTKFQGNMKAMLGAGYIDTKVRSDFS